MNKLIQELVQHLHKIRDVPNDKYVMHFLHKFLVTSFTEALSNSKRIASLWELSTLLACMLQKDATIAFKTPEVTMNLLSQAFRTGRSMLVHCAVAGSLIPHQLTYPFKTLTSSPESDIIRSVAISLRTGQ